MNWRILAITPTGGRPDALRQCAVYMQRQTVQPDVWCVVNDVDDSFPAGSQHISPSPRWQPGDKPTQHRNITVALDDLMLEPDDVLIFFEDDDWYHPEWIETAAAAIRDGFDAFGEIPSWYYHVRYRAYRNMENTTHASLAATAISGRALPLLREILQAGEWIDTTFWRRCRSKTFLQAFRSPRVVGMKGMTGRPGISDIHRREPSVGYIRDENMSRLRQWIGMDDAEFYGRFYIQNEPEPEPEPATTNRYANFVGIGGQRRYRCPYCALDHYDPAFIDGHLTSDHKEMLPPPVTLFDFDDKPIKQRIIVPQ